MRYRAATLLVLSIVVAICALAVNAEQKSIELPLDPTKLKPGPGMTEASICTTCHSTDYISTQPRLTRTVWKAEVVKMQAKYGAPIQTNLVDKIVDYLTANYGQENPPATNAAPAK